MADKLRSGAEEPRLIAEELVDVIPLGMRSIARELRRMEHALPPAHFRLLLIISRQPHHLHELAEKRGVSPATMSHTISTFVERGWVRRSEDQGDRRRVLIELAPLGRAVLAETQQQLSLRFAEFVTPLSASERQQLAAALLVLRRLFSQIGEGEAEAPAANPSPPKPQR